MQIMGKILKSIVLEELKKIQNSFLNILENKYEKIEEIMEKYLS